MILSYSLDVRQLPLDILFFNFMFSYLNFISLLKNLTKIQVAYSMNIKYKKCQNRIVFGINSVPDSELQLKGTVSRDGG
jgi:hypothetical protein